MDAAPYPDSPERRGPTLRGRATAFLLALVLEILLVIGLITLSPHELPPLRVDSDPKTFTLAPTVDKEAAAKPAPRHIAKVKHASGGASPAPRSPRPPTSVAPPTPPITLPGVIPLDLASNDLAKAPHTAGSNAPGEGETGVGKDSGSVYGPGEGPGGERLYNVEWYREPTDAELSGYLPNGAPPGGYADIACRMIEHYHVENCRSLDESPVGSGLARSMRQAAWQFLVRPPRVGGRQILGTWVRIHISFSKAPPKE